MDEPCSTNETGASPPFPQDSTETFVSLFAGCETDLRTYVLSLLHNWADADDVLQRTSLVMWRKFGDWAPGTPFKAWACTIARYEVNNFLRARSRDRLHFDDDLVDSLSMVYQQIGEQLDDRRQALNDCLKKLTPSDRQILAVRYGETQLSMRKVALVLGRPFNTIRKATVRLHRALYQCIERTVSAENRR